MSSAARDEPESLCLNTYVGWEKLRDSCAPSALGRGGQDRVGRLITETVRGSAWFSLRAYFMIKYMKLFIKKVGMLTGKSCSVARLRR